MNIGFTWPDTIDDVTAQGVVALYNDAIASTTVIGYTRALEGEQAAALISDLNGALERRAKSLMAVWLDGRMVGMVLLTSNQMPNCRHIAELSKGIVHSAHQKTGIVKVAFLEIVRHCESSGIDLLTLDVREHSAPHRIWHGLGFKEYGRLADYAREDGRSMAGVFLCQTTVDLKALLSSQPPAPAQPLLDKDEFKALLRSELEQRITMMHPIVKKIVNGEPNWELLRYMTLQGYQLTKHFLEYIETLYHHCPRGDHKRRLLWNMFEEETGRFSKTANHVKLMENFIRAIGISDAERDAAQPLPKTKALIDYRMQLVRDRNTFHMGAAAVMIASEGQNLETTAGEARHDLLPRMYGLTPQDLLFFSVHQKEDVGHVREGISLVADLCTTPRMQAEALEAVRRTCDLFYGMYDGVAEVFAA